MPLVCTLLFLLISIPSAVFAADSVTLPELIISAPQDASPAPTTFHEVVRPSDQPRSITSISELIARTPGTMVRSLGSLGSPATVSIRGSSAEQVAVYLDGARLNSGAFGFVDLSTIPLAAVERIDIIRGGGTAQFGGDAIGGVIHIVTKDAEPGQSVEAHIGGGSFFTDRMSTSFHRKTDNYALVTSFSHHHSEGNYSFSRATTNLAGIQIGGGGSFTRENNRSIAESLLVKFDKDLSASTHLSLTNDFFFTNRQLPGTEFEATQLAPGNPLEASQRLYRNSTHASVTMNDLWTPRFDAELGLHNVFEWNDFGDPSPALGPAIDRLSLTDAINPYARIDYLIPTKGGGHDLTLRYDYRRDMFDDRARNGTTQANGYWARDTHSLLLQDEWTLGHDRVSIVPAFRYNFTSDFGNDINGRLGIVGRPAKWLRLKANVETAYRAPTFLELYHPDQGYIRGNPFLEKERALHWDAGIAVEHNKVQAEVAYFQQFIGNSILFVPISATTIAPINTFNVRTDGVEASVSTTPVDFARASANYTWLRARFTSTGQQLPGRPTHKANARLEFFRDLAPRVHGSLFTDVQWVSALPINVSNTTFLARRTTLDAGIKSTWKKTRRHEYSAAIEMTNVTNIQVYDNRGFPLPRRAIFVSLGGKWI